MPSACASQACYAAQACAGKCRAGLSRAATTLHTYPALCTYVPVRCMPHACMQGRTVRLVVFASNTGGSRHFMVAADSGHVFMKRGEAAWCDSAHVAASASVWVQAGRVGPLVGRR